MLVNDFLQISAQNTPDKPAVWHKNEWMTYSELDQQSSQIAQYLIRCGIQSGDRVAILLENSFDYITSYYGILKAGAVTVALNTESKTDALQYYLNDSGAQAIITHKRFSRYLVPALSKVPYLKLVIVDQDDLRPYEDIGHCQQKRLQDIYTEENKSLPVTGTIDVDLASLVYTSGSTGKPKAVMLSHLNIVSNTRSIVSYLNLNPADRIMVVLPFYYIYGKSLLNTHIFTGGSVVIDNRFAFPNSVLETMKNTEVTGFSGVPSTFMILLSKSSLRNYKFESLRYITQAGGAMAPSIQKEVVKVFSPAKLYIMYGATEASARLSYLDPDHLHKKWGSIGKAIPNVEMAILNEHGHRLGPRQEGEIAARGANIMSGYWNDPEETERALRNGWYMTGDIGVRDEEGFFYVVGRTRDMIKVGGERVSAKEVEEVLLEINEIQEVAVIGIEDDILGEAIKAYVVPARKEQIEPESIKNYCAKRLPSFKIPKHIEFAESLPKNESGKILKQELRRQNRRI